MLNHGTAPVSLPPALSLSLDGGVIAHRMGDGIIVIDQRDDDTRAMQRVVVDRADLEALLAWTA